MTPETNRLSLVETAAPESRGLEDSQVAPTRVLQGKLRGLGNPGGWGGRRRRRARPPPVASPGPGGAFLAVAPGSASARCLGRDGPRPPAVGLPPAPRSPPARRSGEDARCVRAVTWRRRAGLNTRRRPFCARSRSAASPLAPHRRLRVFLRPGLPPLH